MRFALSALFTKASTRPRISETVSSLGTCQLGACAIGEGATVCHGDCSAVSASRPSHGTWVEAFRPAWPICRPSGFFVNLLRKCTIFERAASLFSLYRPLQACVMRPSRVTCVASSISRPAPPQASWPRCMRCQSFIEPSSAEYWHIGETTARLGSVTPPSSSGVNRLARGNADAPFGERLADRARKGHGAGLVAVQAQRVGCHGDRLARKAGDEALLHHRQRLAHGLLGVLDHGARRAARRERPLVGVAAIGEYLAADGNAGFLC